jgi:hypothetical protein
MVPSGSQFYYTSYVYVLRGFHFAFRITNGTTNGAGLGITQSVATSPTFYGSIVEKSACAVVGRLYINNWFVETF